MRLGPADLPAMLRAATELIQARLTLTRMTSSDLAALATLGQPETGSAALEQPAEIARIAYLLPRIAARLPFRADCVVQALAARHWLASLGHDTQLFLGTRSGGAPFEAHAWLLWQGTVVTGGEVSAYTAFQRSDQRQNGR
jgi:hypothetical protein